MSVLWAMRTKNTNAVILFWSRYADIDVRISLVITLLISTAFNAGNIQNIQTVLVGIERVIVRVTLIIFLTWKKIHATFFFSGKDFISWGKNVHTSLKRRPEVVYHLVQTFFFTFMAVTTLRFKFLWMPHICIVAAGIICSQDLWSFLLSKIYLTCGKERDYIK